MDRSDERADIEIKATGKVYVLEVNPLRVANSPLCGARRLAYRCRSWRVQMMLGKKLHEVTSDWQRALCL